MSQNVEIKVRLQYLNETRSRARALGAVPTSTDEQTDVYYAVNSSGAERIKLRTVPGKDPELIRYHRSEDSSVRTSDYTLIRGAEAMREAREYERKAAPEVVVRKSREILLLENVRIHLDQVDGLGCFLELEAVVDSTHDPATCRQQVADLIVSLSLPREGMVAASYSDLLLARSP